MEQEIEMGAGAFHRRSNLSTQMTTETKKDIDEQLKELQEKYGFTRPDRGLNNDGAQNLHWREGLPDYRQADLFFFQGKSRDHAPGSLEQIVENLVKVFEMQVTHLTQPEECSCIDANSFHLKVNNEKNVNLDEILAQGTYNHLLRGVSEDLYDSSQHSFDTSQKLFKGTFLEGFAWELLEVFSGPPRVSFTWRHWGKFSGEYKGQKGNDDIIEMYGFAVATVNEELKLTRVEVYFKPEGMMKCLEGKMDPSEVHQGKALFGACCPIVHQK